jgi:K+-transporting ATPase KdpF subunit
MTVLYLIGGAISVALAIYLFFAMLKPESLQ